MKRSPAPTPSSPLTTSRATSESASSRSTRCCIRSVISSRGRCTPGRSTRISWRSASRSVATPRIARRVVCGRTETIATWRADQGVDQGRLADVRPPGEADEAGAWSSQPRQHPRLHVEHLAVVGLVVVAAEVEDAVDGGLGDVAAVRGADRDVAELARAGAGPSSSIGKASTSVGASLPRCSRFSSRIRPASTISTARWPSSTPAAASAAATASRRSRRDVRRGRRVRQLVVLCRRRRRSAARACGGRRPRRRTRRRRCP